MYHTGCSGHALATSNSLTARHRLHAVRPCDTGTHPPHSTPTTRRRHHTAYNRFKNTLESSRYGAGPLLQTDSAHRDSDNNGDSHNSH